MNLRSLASLSLLLVVTAAVRAPGLGHPLTAQGAWREMDYTLIAENFRQDGMPLAYPRMGAWARPPGYIEMEFPVVPWLAALSRPAFGDVLLAGRSLSLLSSLALVLFLYLLVRIDFGATAALAAGACAALSPLAIYYGRAFYPDPLAIACGVGGLYALRRWLRDRGPAALASAALLLSLACMTRLTLLQLGLPAVAMVLACGGPRQVRDARVWIVAAVVLAATITWYGHAASLYETYGNTVGVLHGHDKMQGPTYWVRPSWWEAMAGRIASLALVPAALPLLFLGVLAPPRPGGAWLLAWMAAGGLHILVAAEGNLDMNYYQLTVLPPLAAAVGLGASRLWDPSGLSAGLRWARRAAVAAGLAGLGAVLVLAASPALAGRSVTAAVAWGQSGPLRPLLRQVLAGLDRVPASSYGEATAAVGAAARGMLPAAALAAVVGIGLLTVAHRRGAVPAWGGGLVLVLLVSAGVGSSRATVGTIYRTHSYRRQAACAAVIRALTPPGSRILFAGAYTEHIGGNDHETVLFYYSGRDGWVLEESDFRAEAVERLRAAGASYLATARPELLADHPDFADWLRRKHRVLRWTDELALVELVPAAGETA